MAEETPKSTTTGHQPTSNSELMSSAKTVAEAAQAAATQRTDDIDKAKVAGASEDLLGAARTYGKLDDQGAGQYVEKAEGYLHKMHTSDDSSATTTAPTTTTTTTTTTTPSATESGGEAGQKEKASGGGIMNMAKGLFKK